MGMSPENVETLLRLFVAFVLGGLIGFEREIRGKEAGFRTYSLVCLGSALMMIVSIQVFEAYKGMTQADPGRIAAQVVTGIGFLGAGAIIRSRDREMIKGLTTAAGIWVAAGIGLSCGLGYYLPAVVTTVLTLLILVVFSKVGQVVRNRKE